MNEIKAMLDDLANMITVNDKDQEKPTTQQRLLQINSIKDKIIDLQLGMNNAQQDINNLMNYDYENTLEKSV